MTIASTLKEMKNKGMKMEIEVTWCAEDILGDFPDLTPKQVEDVLYTLEGNHDPLYGITWETINHVVDEVLSESEE